MKQINSKDFDNIIKNDFENYVQKFNQGYQNARIKNTHIEDFKSYLESKQREFEKEFPVNQDLYYIRHSHELNNSFNRFFEAIKHYCKQPNKSLEILAKGIAHQMAISFVWKEIYYPDSDINAFPIEIREYKINTKVKPIIQSFSSNQNRDTYTETKITRKKLNYLFIDKKDFEPCINALLKVDVPIIDKKKNYLLGQRHKGAIVAWVEVLKQTGKINQNIQRKNLAALLNNTFKGLAISDRTLSNVKTTAVNKYKKQLTNLIK